MRIIVNAAPLNNILTGIGRYIRELYTQIQVLRPDIEISFFNGAGLSRRMPAPQKDYRLWELAVKTAWRLPSFVPYMARIIARQKSARRFFRLSLDGDIYHEAGYFPYQTPQGVKTAFTVHDLSWIRFPDFHPKDRLWFFQRYFEASLSRADVLITPSQFTRREIQTLYPGVNAGIHAIPLGFNPSVFFKRAPHEVASFKAGMGLPEKFFLYAGTSDPRKNIRTMMKALLDLPKPVKMVCTGWSGWEKTATRNLFPADLKDRIIFTGYVPDSVLALLYAGAGVFVYPSYYEGFGLPVLEAMACGCPVICSNEASLPEVAEDAAAYCGPDDAGCLADSIREILGSEALYKEMSRKSLIQAKKFSWIQTAEKTLKVFEDIL